MKKAVSTIIAVILMLIITIGLAGTAYIFISGILTTKMSKTISILSATCNETGYITVVVSNDGTDTIKDDEIKVLIDGESKGNLGVPIDPRNSEVKTIEYSVSTDKSHNLVLVSPSNSVKVTIWCPS